MLTLGSNFPNFVAKTTIGEIDFHQWLGDSWGMLCSHPADYTPVCTTELAKLTTLMPEFVKRNIKIIALSCDSIENHAGWTSDINCYAKNDLTELPYPIIADVDRSIAHKLNMLDLDERNQEGLALTARTVFIIDPNKKFRLSILYPATTGRNFDEILRVIDSLQLTDKFPVATPVDWKVGNDVMIQPSLSETDAKARFSDIKVATLPSGRQYLRQTAQPKN